MGKFIDLTGQVFGRLTVVERVENNKYAQPKWLCQCTCGNKTIVVGSKLKQGHTQSCGCLYSETVKRNRSFIDEAGHVYGKLTVIRFVGYKYGNPIWLCHCECGNEKIARGVSLRAGNIKSCGCSRLGKPQKRGPDSPHWRGGRRVTKEGYVILHRKNDPRATKGGKILEHVLVMSDIIGRPLTKEETVHHKNGIKSDNSPPNLELWASSHPRGQRVSDLVEWAKELLSKYEPTALSK